MKRWNRAKRIEEEHNMFEEVESIFQMINKKDYEENKVAVEILCFLKRLARSKHGAVKNERLSSFHSWQEDPLRQKEVFRLTFDLAT